MMDSTVIAHSGQPSLHRPSARQPGSLFEQFGAITTYLSIPWFAREAMPDECWQHARERFIPHAKGGVR